MITETSEAIKFTFSGHESFQCRHLWLKKGYDFLMNGKSFNSEEAVVELGVGKNMVRSIKYWMRAFNLLESDDYISELAHFIFGSDGVDPYLENDATLWLLHYQLIISGYASIYPIIFNDLRKERMEFTRSNFVSYVKRRSENEPKISFNLKTLTTDFSVFTRLYLPHAGKIKDKEDSLAGIFSDLDLVKLISKEKDDFYIIENLDRQEIPYQILLFAILSQDNYDLSLSFNQLETGYNSIGSIFALSRQCLYDKIEEMVDENNFIVFSDQAGIKELQFKSKPEANNVLRGYYGLR